jgi:hypothetical protein
MLNVDVHLLVVPDCPNEHAADARLRAALNDVGLCHIRIDRVVVDTQAAADRWQFVGSPTFLVNGADPFAGPGERPALACRVYRNADGTAGLPDLVALRRALRSAAHDSSRA